jgi:Fe-S-cluster containining protein
MTEDKCLRCGKCCYIDNTNIRCIYLTEENICSVYDNRPSWCMTAKQMKDIYKLPEGCGYLKGE